MAAPPSDSDSTSLSNPVAPPAKLKRPLLKLQDSAGSSIISSGSSGNDRHDMMAKYLYRRCTESRWLEPTEEDDGVIDPTVPSNLGVLVRRADGIYVSEPVMLINPALVHAVERLHPAAAFTMSSEITHSLLQQITPFQRELILDPPGVRVPVVGSLEELAQEQSMVSRDAFVCICRKERLVLVWCDSVQGMLAHGTDVETMLLGLVWGSHIPMSGVSMYRSMAMPSMPIAAATRESITTPPTAVRTLNPSINEKLEAVQMALEKEQLGDQAYDPEKDEGVPPRPFLLSHAVVIGLAMVLVVVVEMACVAKLLTEVRLDGGMLRFALLATVPLFGAFSLFFMIVITGSLFQLFGPLKGCEENSMFYSAKPPVKARYKDLELPHVTIQMPVYMEGLNKVIIPTITSLMAAVRYYEAQGGTASVYVNDDGMQAVDPELAAARAAFYELNGIGWCSRPKQNTDKEAENYFIRKGQFKKASNMNYCLDFSTRVEDEMFRLIGQECASRGITEKDITIDEEDILYKQAVETIVEQSNGRTRAAGNVRLGEVILIVDSDTRVPEDCLLFGALEMHESPEVALLQHASGIMQVVGNVFENGITYFTNLIYTSIQFAVGSGDCAPFVGHNTFIRWKALQSISFQEDDMTKFWSEDHVSEDFDVSLRLQMAHFVVRLATYHNGGFKEGVSLTVFDELARWEKYAYGCNELVFNPLIKWYKGPFTRLFLRFLWSNIKITSKITILAYIGTYYAIASAIPLTLANYLIVGWFNDDVDQFYIASWKIFVGMAVVFNVLSPLAYAMLRHRLGQRTFFWSLIETAKWTPMFLLFFGGISYHLLKALICHFFSIKMEWTATAKELEASGFRVGLDRIVRDFKYMYLFLVPMVGGMVYLALYAPRAWRITDFAAIVPLANQIGCHALLPFALGLF